MSETIVQRAGHALLKSRVERLARLIELDAPAVILCRDAFLVFRAACQIDPEIAGRALAARPNSCARPRKSGTNGRANRE